MRYVVASLNTLGLPFRGARIAERYREIAAGFESSTVDVVNLQEVFTYYHLTRLTRHMPSYRQVSYRRSLIGPAGGLVTLSRVPVAATRYHQFPASGMPSAMRRRRRLYARTSGALVTRLATPELHLVNIHPSANTDGDWSPGNRFHMLQQAFDALMSGEQEVFAESFSTKLTGAAGKFIPDSVQAKQYEKQAAHGTAKKEPTRKSA